MTRLAPLLLAAALVAGCANAPATDHQPGGTAPAPGSVADGSEVRLGLGEGATLADGSRLTYLRLVNDSRCPPDVQCVWAGDAEIALRWRPAHGRSQEFSLHTAAQRGNTSARIGERRVTLVALERGIAPAATLRIDRAD